MNYKENQELVAKYKQGGSFTSHMDKLEKKYSELSQQAYYTDFYKLQAELVKKISADSDLGLELFGEGANELDLVLVFGANTPEDLDKYLLTFVKVFSEPQQDYAIIFLGTLAGEGTLNSLKRVLELLPLGYLQFLTRIFVTDYPAREKSNYWFTFNSNSITHFLKNKTYHVGSLEQICLKISARPLVLLEALPKNIAVRITLAPPSLAQPPQPPPQLHLTAPSVQPVAKPKMHPLEHYEVGETGAPFILELLICRFEERPEYLLQEGLFRKSIDIEEETWLLSQIQERNYDFVSEVTNPHFLANCIKRFLSYLDEPLIPYALFDQIIVHSPATLAQLLPQLLKTLPHQRWITLLLLVEFFMDKVLPHAEHNKMGVSNIAICLGPCLMRPKQATLQQELVYATKVPQTATVMLKMYEKIFGSKKQRQEEIRQSLIEQGHHVRQSHEDSEQGRASKEQKQQEPRSTEHFAKKEEIQEILEQNPAPKGEEDTINRSLSFQDEIEESETIQKPADSEVKWFLGARETEKAVRDSRQSYPQLQQQDQVNKQEGDYPKLQQGKRQQKQEEEDRTAETDQFLMAFISGNR